MKKTFDTLSPYLEDFVRIIVAIFVIAAVLIFVGQKSLALFYRFPLDYGEAPLVDQAMRLAQGQNIYRADITSPPYTVSNYPPLYPLALTPFVAALGPSFWPGRLISTVSTIVTAVLISRMVRHITEERTAGRIAGALFLAFPYVVGWSSLARVDALALVLSIAGLTVITTRQVSRPRDLLPGALFLIAAIYTRQSYGLAAPLAAGVWVWHRHGWRGAANLASYVAGIGLALFLVLNLATQGGFYFNIVTANVNPYNVDTLARYWREIRHNFPILLVAGAAGLGLAASFLLTTRRANASPQRSAWLLAGAYLLGASLSALTIGKIGSNVNYLLEFAAALSLTAGLWIAGKAIPWVERTPAASFAIRNGMMALLTVQMGFMMRETLLGPVQDIKARRQHAVRLNDLLWEIRRTDGPVIADEFMGLLTLNDRALLLQPFELTQLANAGLWDQSSLLEAIRDHEFPMILIHHYMGYPVYTERWTPRMLDTILTFYIADGWAGESIIFRPRDTTIHPAPSLTACPGAPWQLPTRADLGVWWLTQGLIFMGEGFEGRVPVYAVADGLLMRQGDWRDAVAIVHDDPTNPGGKVWTYYAGMAPAWGEESYVSAEFPRGSDGIPVTKGQLLGYQGTTHQGTMAIWPHAYFGVAQPLRADGAFPHHVLTGAPHSDPNDPNTFIDPSPYLGTAISSPIMGTPVWLPLRCLGMAR